MNCPQNTPSSCKIALSLWILLSQVAIQKGTVNEMATRTRSMTRNKKEGRRDEKSRINPKKKQEYLQLSPFAQSVQIAKMLPTSSTFSGLSEKVSKSHEITNQIHEAENGIR
jgi:hypothetical protein